MFKMDSQTQLKVDIIAKVTHGDLTVSDAQKLLGKSQRTVERYVQRYGKEGIQFVIHKNTFHSPAHKIHLTVCKFFDPVIFKKVSSSRLSRLRLICLQFVFDSMGSIRFKKIPLLVNPSFFKFNFDKSSTMLQKSDLKVGSPPVNLTSSKG